MRLWGAHGQMAMEETHVALLNASPAGTEAMKNLVLPGIGSFTVVDAKTVDQNDLANNFFVQVGDVGSSRAECVTKLLQELNEHVAGKFVDEDISQVLEARPDFLDPFKLVIATQMSAGDLRMVAHKCAERSIPLLVTQCYGLVGTLRVLLNEHYVVESHPEHPFPDLRVLAPPAELVHFVKDRYSNLCELASADYAHIPYVAILLKAVGEWSAANNGQMPSSYQHKKELRSIIEKYRRPGVQADQNINEALTALNTALSLPSPSVSTRAVLESARERVTELAAWIHSHNTSKDGPDMSVRRKDLSFWLMAAAVNAFVNSEGKGMLPTNGAIPDMTTHTETYVALQQVYQAQAAADLSAVMAHLQHITMQESLSLDLIDHERLKIFCKNAQHIALLSYRSMEDEYETGLVKTSTITSALDDGASAGTLYVLLRSAEAFYAQRSHWPGANDVESDVPVFKYFVGDVLKDLNISFGNSPCPISDDWIHEFCRWGGGELHSIAALIGGVAAQEAIKAITQQYIPLNNTFIFNGANGSASVLEI